MLGFYYFIVYKKISQNVKKKFYKKFKEIEKLISNLKLKDNVFVHRDFMFQLMLKNQIVIDSQDALI